MVSLSVLMVFLRWIEKISRLTKESLKTESTSKGLKAEPGDLVLVSSGGTWCRALVKNCQDLNIIQVVFAPFQFK